MSVVHQARIARAIAEAVHEVNCGRPPTCGKSPVVCTGGLPLHAASAAARAVQALQREVQQP